VLKTFFKSEEPTLEAKLKVKYIALAVAVAAFVITFIESNL
jgi:hypothetical protein